NRRVPGAQHLPELSRTARSWKITADTDDGDGFVGKLRCHRSSDSGIRRLSGKRGSAARASEAAPDCPGCHEDAEKTVEMGIGERAEPGIHVVPPELKIDAPPAIKQD